MNLLIIGLGNIGKRHLESALLLESIKQIYVYDLSHTTLDELPKSNKEIIFLNDLFNLPKRFDFCVVATPSFNREVVVNDLLNISEIKYLILEKVLFQKFVSYDLMKNIFNSTQTIVYVNCPRRLMKDYIELRDKIGFNNIKQIKVTGGNWNIASNAIHFLDLIVFFSSSKSVMNYSLNTDLDESIFPSKREGYIEFFGKIAGFINGIEFFIECSNNDEDLIIEFELDNENIIINETSQVISYSSEQEHKVFKIEYVSQLTYRALKDLAERGKCNLIEYNESSILHKTLIMEFLKHQNKFIESSDGRCLIT